MAPTSITDEPTAIDLRHRSRCIDSLIPVVQRSAGPAALLRDSRLVVGVSTNGDLTVRLVPGVR